MAEKEKLQAIFFDFDGVILDSTNTKTEGFYKLFEQYPEEIISQIVEYHQLHGGISRVEKIRNAHQNIIGKPLSEKEVDEWAMNYSDLVLKRVLEVDFIAGAKEFLDTIPDSILVFVISGTPEPELQYVVEKRNLSQYFNKVLGSPIKKPEHVRNLLDEFSLKPENCVFIGDALTDYDAAMETRLEFIGIQGDIHFPQGTVVLEDCNRLGSVLSDRFNF